MSSDPTTTTTSASKQQLSPSQPLPRRPRGHSNVSDADLELQELPEWVMKGEEGGAAFQGQDKMIKKFVITGGPCSGKVRKYICIYIYVYMFLFVYVCKFLSINLSFRSIYLSYLSIYPIYLDHRYGPSIRVPPR